MTGARFIVRSDIGRCPQRIIVTAHYRDDGTCFCAEGHLHHWVPRREGKYGVESAYVMTCECGATYRNGEVVGP